MDEETGQIVEPKGKPIGMISILRNGPRWKAERPGQLPGPFEFVGAAIEPQQDATGTVDVENPGPAVQALAGESITSLNAVLNLAISSLVPTVMRTWLGHTGQMRPI